MIPRLCEELAFPFLYRCDIPPLCSTYADIAHDLPAVLVKRNYENLSGFVKKARDLVFKLDNFWMYIEIGHDPEHIGTDWDTAYSNSTMFVDRLIELIEGYKSLLL